MFKEHKNSMDSNTSWKITNCRLAQYSNPFIKPLEKSLSSSEDLRTFSPKDNPILIVSHEERMHRTNYKEIWHHAFELLQLANGYQDTKMRIERERVVLHILFWDHKAQNKDWDDSPRTYWKIFQKKSMRERNNIVGKDPYDFEDFDDHVSFVIEIR